MSKGRRLKILYISPFYPRRCGIASYTKDLLNTYSTLQPEEVFEIAAINDIGDDFVYPSKVKMLIQNDGIQSYQKSAELINHSDYDFIHLQHEFGLYQGENGSYITELTDRLKKPYVVTFHTVQSNPSNDKIRIVRSLARRAAAIIVMADEAITRLKEVYQLDTDKICKIPHGVPSVDYSFPEDEAKVALGVLDKKIISTFGLISQNKGIEYVIDAIPMIARKVPEILYLIIGKTHPLVRRHEGERYRQMLNYRIKKYGITENVKFINKYLGLDDLIRYLHATDIYLTPYLEPEQITSGTLSYALGVGKVCVSTPYAYAKEVLGAGRGHIIPFRDSREIANRVSDLLLDNSLRAVISKRAYDYSRGMIWEKVAADHIDLFQRMRSSFEGCYK